MPDINADLIAQIAASHQGRPAQAPSAPTAVATQPGADQGQAPTPPTPPKADPSPTAMEQAQSKVAPADQAAQTDQAAISMVKLGDKEYTPQQLEGTLSRYKDLNFKWQTHKPVADVITNMMAAAKESGYEAKPEEMAGLVEAAVKAYIKNPTMGNNAPRQGSAPGAGASPMGDEPEGGLGDTDQQYEAWEKENAVKLPPGFKETAATSKAMAAKMDQMMAMFQQVISGGMAGQQATAQAGQTMEAATSVHADAATKMISNNLNSAFQKAGVPVDDSVRADFRTFAAQRGYDFPDFMSPELTQTVVADFKANKDAPEMQRLLDVARRRQAFTGSVEGAPGAGGAGGGAPAGVAADPMFQAMTNTAMQGRNMGR